MLDLTIHEPGLRHAVACAREREIVIPTFAQMRTPASIPEGLRNRLRQIGLGAIHPLNLFRITWKNEPVAEGGGFGGVNRLEFPSRSAFAAQGMFDRGGGI